MDTTIYFVIWEIIILILTILLLFCFRNKHRLSLVKQVFICVFSLYFGRVLFYETFSLHLTIQYNYMNISDEEKEKIIEPYHLNIDPKTWVFADYPGRNESATSGTQIAKDHEIVFEGVDTSILISVSDQSHYVGKRDRIIKPSSPLILEMEKQYKGTYYKIKQYKLPDGSEHTYGADYFNPYYIFEWKSNNLYYDIRFVNMIPPEEMIYTYDMNRIKEEDLHAYLTYISSILSLE